MREAAAVLTAFSGFPEAAEAAETVRLSHVTGLQPGVNKKRIIQTVLKT
jgi:hypothetical protein